MTVWQQGETATLYVQWYEYPGGPLVNVNAVTITITQLATSTTVIGPTSTGVNNPATGVNTYLWAIGASQAVGDYLVTWNGTDAGTGAAVQGSEIITVGAASGDASPPGLCAPWPAILRDCVIPTAALPFTGSGVQIASEVLWALTGRQFGLCQRTVRPCRETCYSELLGYAIPGVGDTVYGGLNYAYPRPLLYAGNWYNITCGSCVGGCSCTTVSQVTLPGPAHEVLQVLVDGVPLTKNVDYRLDNSRWLIRLGGETWPLCNNLNLADTEVGTWSVTYNYGTPVPTLGQAAVGILGIEFAKALACDDSCALPKPVQSITRQGVSITFLDPNEVFSHGRTGLYLPDLFIQTVNPRALQSRARVYDLDNPDFGRRLGTG